ncbi:MAG: hypothetical protein HYR88_03100 [Verrucomicrobia bacterium]|nr:hypothetical protein [Verrucomicrobiota bacterium]
MKRRHFLRMTAGGAGVLAASMDLGFLGRLPSVSAAEARVAPAPVSLHPELEPIVRLLENTPRERVLEEVAARLKVGMSYREILGALLLAGVRNIQPRPVGFKFHAVLVVNSAHLASLASPDRERWLPLFWAIDQFKSSQAADVREGDWTMGPVDEAAVPPSHKARQALIDAMDRWDESGADAAIAGMARTAGADEIFEVLSRYGARDFREIGHKEIYLANSYRTLEVIGWRHAEPVLRSLVYAMLDRVGDKDNPSKSDYPADRPYRRNLELGRKIRPGWLDGRVDPTATTEMLRAIREGSAKDASDKVVELLNRGAGPQSIFDALFAGAGELLMRSPGILSMHATTFTNATHYAWHRVRDDDTRRLLLLQNAAFMPLFRGNSKDKGLRVDELEPISPQAGGSAAVDEIFGEIGPDHRVEAARKVLGYLKADGSAKALIDAGRRFIFLKGRDAHDYKFTSAVHEDFYAMPPALAQRYLAASVFNWRGSRDTDNELIGRVRAAIDG